MPKICQFAFVLFLLFLQFVHIQSQSPGPFWIDSLDKARKAGLRLDIVRDKICADQRQKNQNYSNLDQIGELFELGRAHALLATHTLVGIEVRALCGELAKRKRNWPQISNEISSSVEVKLLEDEDDEGEDMNGVGTKQNEKKGRQKSEDEKGGGGRGGGPDGQKEPLVPTGARTPIGIDVAGLGPEGREAVERMKSPEGEAELDAMVARMETMARQGGVKPLPSRVLEPLLERSKYDRHSAPAFVEGRPVEVRVGIQVQSIANFQLATMDYDMDMWLRMSWRDPRLAQNLSTPILINDELFLRKIWRPDAFFVNARDALFHRVSRLNFYAFVFPRGGEVFMEARLYVKPKSQLVLCKYPHDSQTLRLRISSIASTIGSTRFRWFSRPSDAIRVDGQLQLPELYIAGVHSGECRSARKTGNFSCLESRFLMKRSISYHLWQTYVPTATCVLFSWISVWLPEEFVEGRVFVALTVFLTLSAESSSAKETLPKVSYVKAIDVWFGFTAVFVFFTMLQALLVIGLEHMSAWTRKSVVEQAGELSAFKAAVLMMDSRRYHRLARSLDEFFKVMYPVGFLVFLFVYVFVVIQGEEQKCLQGWMGGTTEAND